MYPVKFFKNNLAGKRLKSLFKKGKIPCLYPLNGKIQQEINFFPVFLYQF